MVVGNPASLLTIPISSISNSISFCLLTPNESLTIQPHVSYISNLSKSFSISSLSSLRFGNNYSLSSPQQSQHAPFKFRSLSSRRGNLFCLCSVKKRSKSGAALMQMSDFDDEMDDEFDDFEEDGNLGDYDDEDDGMFVPFGKMKKWLENKPRGFGEGKVYNTSTEDKLLEEMQKSQQAQAANINNLKNNPVHSAANKDVKHKKAPEVVPSGIRVCVANLPKKKNIQRDLKSAFKEVTGVVNIIPAVSGNKKTKDPICKGYAFVDFKSQENADRFVRQFSGQKVSFGRIQKQIKCKMANSHSSDDESEGNIYSGSNLNVHAPQESSNTYFDTDDSYIEENVSDVPVDWGNELVTAKLEDVMHKMESSNTSILNNDDTVEPILEHTSGSFSPKKQDKSRTTKKNIVMKGRGKKVPKMEILGSAKRLKVKEKAVLNDVFAKYRLQSPVSQGKRADS
ncbi:hypothetical protein JCGZ_21776 [Jatropha curcas]|uniref:RRM domain-containing protein n=1 Tax=Jatropha curcas TaxID=180498 RepID=A0A067JMS4_JATCU|nr:uncharacterized protein LOC105649845 [Jatropha curcas]KDP21305.1 hypothetical protein JCGZ_21776 [Jatropha curcas]